MTWTNPFPSPTLVSSITSVALSGYELHPPSAYIQSWNFTLERQVGFSSAIEISYVGSKGTHLGMQVQLNQPFDRSPALPNGEKLFPTFGNINYFKFEGNSNYNGATVTFKRRFVHGFTSIPSITLTPSRSTTTLLGAV